jgi:hypothetical protein
MHMVEETKYGYRLVLEGRIDEGVEELESELRGHIHPKDGPFSLMMDLRKVNAFPHDIREVLKRSLYLCHQAGMERNAVVLNSAIATLQARRLAREAGVEAWSRYIDATYPDWERTALDWLVRAVEPATP